MHRGRLYFNTRTKRFEMTDYVRKLNRSKSAMLACAEPVDPLPSEAELKTRLDRLDQQLNKTYSEVVAKTQKDRVSLAHEGASAHGSSIATRESNFTSHFSRRRSGSVAVFSSWVTSQQRGSKSYPRSGSK